MKSASFRYFKNNQRLFKIRILILKEYILLPLSLDFISIWIISKFCVCYRGQLGKIYALSLEPLSYKMATCLRPSITQFNRSKPQSGKSVTIRESNQAWGVRKPHNAYYYVRKSSIVLAGTGVRKISSLACGFSPIKIHFLITGEALSAE